MEPLGGESGARTAAHGRLRFPRASFSLSRARAVAAGLAAFCLALCLTILLPGAAQAVTFSIDVTGDPDICDNTNPAGDWTASSVSNQITEDIFPTVTTQTEGLDDCADDPFPGTGLIGLTFLGDQAGDLLGLDLRIGALVHNNIYSSEEPEYTPVLTFDENGLGVATSHETLPDRTGPKIGSTDNQGLIREAMRLDFQRDVILTGVTIWTEQTGPDSHISIARAVGDPPYPLSIYRLPRGTGSRTRTIDTSNQEWSTGSVFWISSFYDNFNDVPNIQNRGWRLQGFSFELVPLLPSSFQFSSEGFDSRLATPGDCITGPLTTDGKAGDLLAHYRNFLQTPANHDLCATGGQGFGWQFKFDASREERVYTRIQASDAYNFDSTDYSLSLVVTGGWEGHEREQHTSFNRAREQHLLLEADDLLTLVDERIDPDGDAPGGRGLGVRSYAEDDSFNIAAHISGTRNFLASEFLELNFEEFKTAGTDNEILFNVDTDNPPISTGTASLERVRLTALDIWTEASTPQSFIVEAVGSDVLTRRGRVSSRDRMDLSTSDSVQCANGVGYCQTFITDLISNAGRFFIFGTEEVTADNPNAGIRLRGFRFELLDPPPLDSPTPPTPIEADHDFSPFRFSERRFDNFITAGRCITGEASLTHYVGIDDQCRRGGEGLGWQFQLDASREVSATTNHGLSLVVTGGFVEYENPNRTGPVLLQADNERGLGVRSETPSSSFNIAAFRRVLFDGGHVIEEEFIELNFEEFMIEGAMETFSDEVGEATGTGSLERVRLTALDIWTELAGAQSFRVEAAANDNLEARTPDEDREGLALSTSESAPCANGVGYCQTFITDLLSDAGRFFIFGTEEIMDASSNQNVGIRLRGFSFRVEPLLPPPPEPNLPDDVEQDLNPFRFSAEGFDAFVQNNGCVTGGALAEYGIPVAEQCRASADGTSTGEGWEFTLPSEAVRTETVVDEATGDATTIGYGLRLTITPGEASPHDPDREIPHRLDDGRPDADRPFLEADATGGGRGLGVRSQVGEFLGVTDPDRQPATEDSANLATEMYQAFLPGGTNLNRVNCEPVTRDLEIPVCLVEIQEFIELNFSEYEYSRTGFAIPGVNPIETDNLEVIILTGLEIWTASTEPQNFQVRALKYETPTANRLFDPVVMQVDLTTGTDNAMPCTPLDGSGGTPTGGGYCHSFSFETLANPLFSHVGRFLIVGTQISDDNNPMAGIRLRSIQYQFQAQAQIPLPGGLALALTGLAGLGAVAARRRLRRAA